ncbi:MAG TPA: alpha/beta hydrolase [Chloroflexia bacterium]|nr:alpha/beta hydrolase [Chloroflexia bacterium]
MTTGTDIPHKTMGNYAHVNGLNMYYEIHGQGQPLVLIHGAFSAIGSSFGAMLPGLAKDRQVIGVDLQAHGHTADIDRPLTLEQMADDIAALLQQLNIKSADVFGYSLGAGVGVHMVLRRPELVRKLVLASITYNKAGFYPGFLDGMGNLSPDMMVGSPWHEEYMRIAPHPEDFPKLFSKVMHLNMNIPDLSSEAIRSIKAPTMIIAGDSDIVQPEHAVEMFRLLGGGVIGDLVGLPKSRLAILPGTTHSTMVTRGDWLVPMITEFLDAPAAVEA